MLRKASRLCAMLFIPVLLVACGNDDANDEPLRVSVEAEVLEADAPVEVAATAIEENGDGDWRHGVRVTWNGDEAVILEDARFAHAVEGEDGGMLIIAGRGCGAQWFESDDFEGIGHPCTDDLQIIPVQPREAHEYPVQIYKAVDSVRLERGTYAVDEVIGWWLEDDPQNFAAVDPDGTFTVRLRYVVE